MKLNKELQERFELELERKYNLLNYASKVVVVSSIKCHCNCDLCCFSKDLKNVSL